MKLSLVFLLTFNVCFASINPPKSIKIEENYKVEKTISGELSDNNSFHLIVAKNKDTKNFEIIPFVFDGHTFNRLTSLTFNKEPFVLSFHTSGDVLSLITGTSEEKGDLIVSDINILSEEIKQSDEISFSGFLTSVKSKGESILLFLDNNELNLMSFTNAQINSKRTIVKSETNEELFKKLERENFDNIDTDEFVANGSIKDFRIYLNEGDLYITQQDEKKNATNVYSLNLDNTNQNDFNLSNFKHLAGYKRTTSFLKNKALYRLSIGRSNGSITFNSLDGETSKEIQITKDLISSSSKDFEGVDNFLKQASKDANAPTITLNENKNGNFVLRADYVSRSDYMYNNWWWINLHQQMMMQQQQMRMQQSMRTYGPSDNFNSYFPYFKKAEKHYFEFVVNSSFEVITDNSETTHNEVDKIDLIQEFEENQKLKTTSSVFLDAEFRFFGYDKKDNSFKIYSKDYQ